MSILETPLKTINVSRILIPATPIKLTEHLYPLSLPHINEGNDMMFKFSRTYSGGEYQVEAFCLNFKYENFIEAIKRFNVKDDNGLSLIVVDLYEWKDDEGDYQSSLFVSDDRLLWANEWFYTYVDTRNEHWPPSGAVVRGEVR